MTDTTTIISEVSNMTELEFVEFVEQLFEVAKKNNWIHLVDLHFSNTTISRKPEDLKRLIIQLEETENELDTASSDIRHRRLSLEKLLKK